MASQETTNNAAESATDRKENLVKPSAALPPGFRARPQGPPGSPRHPPNNGPVGQPRPGLGQPPQIRFENRAPLRPFGSGQFVQLRPHGQPRPPGNQLPQRPPQQGQNPAQQGQTPLQHSQYTPQQNQNPFQQSQNPLQKGQNPPIVLNPRFAPSPINRTGPQQSPRLPHPGNFQGQFPRNAHPPQHPGFEHPQRSPDVLGRPQEIAQRQLQRNESLLSFPQLSLPPQREDRKPPLPRIVVERMADVNSARKEQQLDNSISKEKLRENTENDDDDDVVIDGKKSPRPDSKESIIQSAKRPETATINGKVDAKPVSKPREELNGQTNNIAADKVESQTVKSAGSESRSPSAKLDQPRSENANTKVEDKLKVNDEKQNEKSETDKGNLSAGEKRTIASPTPSVTEDKPKSANESSNELKPSERELSVASPDQSLSSTPVKTSQKETGLKTPSKTPDKSRSTTPSESNENQKDHGLKTPTRSSENSRANTPAGSEQSLKTPSKSPDKSRASTPSDSIRSQNEDESKNKTSDKSRSPTPAKIDQAKENPESKPSEATSPEVNDNRQQSKTMYEESDKRENDSTAAKSEPETSENHEPAKDSSNEEQSKDSAPSESASGKPKSAGSTKSDSANISEDTSSENLQKPAEESKPASPNASLSTSAKETRTPVKSPVPSEDERKLSGAESMLPTLKTPEESVKGFDNGQIRSLSPKSPTLPSPKSPVSSKSLTGSAKSVESEKKRASFVESTTDQEMDASNAKTPSKPSTPRIQRAPTPAKLDEMLGKKIATGIENGNGMDESTVSNSIPATNGVEDSPTKKSPSKVKDADKRSTAGSPVKSPNKSIKSLPRTPDTPSSTAGQEKKKVPMNKVQVGAAPSPNLKTVRSKIGSLENTSYKPGGGKVKIENRKLDFSKAQPKIAAKNEKYTPSGGDKKISQVKLQWNAKSKIGSLENATYKPGGGDKKIETVKLDFKDKAKPKVGSKDNAKHTPGGGNVKSSATPPKTPQDTNNDIQTQKVDIKAESKIGSLDNVKHKPGGGEKKIFNDRDYLRQSGSNVESQCASGSQSPVPPGMITGVKNDLPTSDENLNQEC